MGRGQESRARAREHHRRKQFRRNHLTGPRRARILGFTAYNREGKSLWSTSVPVADLQFARAP